MKRWRRIVEPLRCMGMPTPSLSRPFSSSAPFSTLSPSKAPLFLTSSREKTGSLSHRLALCQQQVDPSQKLQMLKDISADFPSLHSSKVSKQCQRLLAETLAIYASYMSQSRASELLDKAQELQQAGALFVPRFVAATARFMRKNGTLKKFPSLCESLSSDFAAFSGPVAQRWLALGYLLAGEPEKAHQAAELGKKAEEWGKGEGLDALVDYYVLRKDASGLEELEVIWLEAREGRQVGESVFLSLLRGYFHCEKEQDAWRLLSLLRDRPDIERSTKAMERLWSELKRGDQRERLLLEVMRPCHIPLSLSIIQQHVEELIRVRDMDGVREFARHLREAPSWRPGRGGIRRILGLFSLTNAESLVSIIEAYTERTRANLDKEDYLFLLNRWVAKSRIDIAERFLECLRQRHLETVEMKERAELTDKLKISLPPQFFLPLLDHYALRLEPDKAARLIEVYRKDLCDSRLLLVDLTAVLKIYCQSFRMKDARALFYRIRDSHGLEPDVVCLTLLLQAYVRAGMDEEAKTCEEELKREFSLEPDVVTYTAIIKAYAVRGELDKALRSLEDMLRQGIPPSVFTFGVLLNGCAERGKGDLAEEILSQVMPRCNVQPSALCLSLLLKAYLTEGRIDKAKEVMRERFVQFSLSPNEHAITILLRAFAEKFDIEGAEWLVREVMVKHGLSLSPGVLQALLKFRHRVEGQKRVVELIKELKEAEEMREKEMDQERPSMD